MKRLTPILAFAVGLGLGLGVTALAGENPFHVLAVLVRGALGSRYDLGMTLFYMTPLLFTGLSVAVAFRGGLFNIGAEGQLAIGALAMAWVGFRFPGLPAPLSWLACLLAGVLAGGGWGAMAGWLRARRGSHEVISTIMLNFIAAGGVSYLVLNHFKNPETQNPETLAVGPSHILPRLPGLGDSPASVALIVAVLLAIFLHWAFERTRWGFELQAVGRNENAARLAGIPVERVRILALATAGAVAAGVGLAEVLGSAHRYKLGFSPDYGFVGIAVALLARGHPLGVIASAFLFGALHKGTADLDLETEHVTRDLALVIQALIIGAVAAEGLWLKAGAWFSSLKPKGGAPRV
jgi:general nucleoside transport system permease protein